MASGSEGPHRPLRSSCLRAQGESRCVHEQKPSPLTLALPHAERYLRVLAARVHAPVAAVCPPRAPRCRALLVLYAVTTLPSLVRAHFSPDSHLTLT